MKPHSSARRQRGGRRRQLHHGVADRRPDRAGRVAGHARPQGPEARRRTGHARRRPRRRRRSRRSWPRAMRPSRSSRSPARPRSTQPAAYVPQDNVIDDRHQRVRRLRRPDRRQRRPRAQSGFVLRQAVRLPGPALAERGARPGRKLNNGRMAATATTADVLAVLGRQFEVVVPVQIGYSRGADMVVVDTRHHQHQPAQGQGAGGLAVQRERVLHPLSRRRRPACRCACCATSTRGRRRANWAWCSTRTPSSPATRTSTSWPAATARLNGCVGWTPRTEEVVEASNGARQGAGVEPQPAGRRRRAAGQQGLRREAPGHGSRAWCTGCSKATAACATTRPPTSPWWRRPSSGPRPTPATNSARCTCRTCRRTSPSSPARSMPPARSAASSSPRCWPTAAMIRNPADPARFVDTSAPRRAAPSGRVRRPDDRDRADPHLDRRRRSRAIRCCQQGHPLLLRAELLDPRQGGDGEPGVPRHDQALPAGEPGLDRAAARPRRQRARGRVPSSDGGERWCRAWRSRRWSSRASAPRRCATRCCERYPEHRPRPHRSWSGAAGRSRPVRTATSTGASRCSGSRSNSQRQRVVVPIRRGAGNRARCGNAAWMLRCGFRCGRGLSRAERAPTRRAS